MEYESLIQCNKQVISRKKIEKDLVVPFENKLFWKV